MEILFKRYCEIIFSNNIVVIRLLYEKFNSEVFAAGKVFEKSFDKLANGRLCFCRCRSIMA